jgi:voltage-gated potassium channel
MSIAARRESAANGADMRKHGNRSTQWRQRTYEVLEHGPVGDRSMRFVSRLLILLVLINIVAVVLESVPHYEAAYGGIFTAIEMVSLVVFTVEYVMRIWVAAEHAPNRDVPPLRARLRYIVSTDGLVDLVSVMPFWLAFSSSPAIRRRCARSSKCSIPSGGRCSAASSSWPARR